MARRRKIKKNTAVKILIAVVAVILIVAIALGIFYAVAPEKFNELKDKLFSSISDPNEPSSPGVQPTLEGTLEMTVLNVGQGDCIFLQFPDGQTMVMDAGSEFGSSNTYDKLADHLDVRGIQALDYMFITHSDYDHIRYVQDILEEYEVKAIYIPRVAEDMSATLFDRNVSFCLVARLALTEGFANVTFVRYDITPLPTCARLSVILMQPKLRYTPI